MTPSPPLHANAGRTAWLGLGALAIAMGIGRFAFTPMLPLMQAEARLTLSEGAWLSAANYLGYLLGAGWTARGQISEQKMLTLGLLGVVIGTAGMIGSPGWVGWAAARFLAGAGSALVLVSASAQTLQRLAAAGRPELSARVFAGVGSGIALAGLLCLAVAQTGGSTLFGWTALSLLAAVGAAVVARGLRLAPAGETRARPISHPPISHPPISHPPSTLPTAPSTAVLLVVCYSLFGFGYILPATFLPAQAREFMPEPRHYGWIWPLLGLAAALSTLGAVRLGQRLPGRRLWAGGQLVMAVSILLPAWRPGPASVLLAALGVGGTFMLITMVALQVARAENSAAGARLIGQMTTGFALGQLIGPCVLALLAAWPDQQWLLALSAAALALLASSGLLLVQNKTSTQTSV